MDYQKLGDAYYIRIDKGDEMVSSILEVCRREGIASATYSGIGGCQDAEIQTFNPAAGEFDTERVEGMLELVSFMGNVITDASGTLYPHTHALFSYVEDGQHKVVGGHIKSTTVLYTAEIELRPVFGGAIGHMHDDETGTAFWQFGN